jgi:polyphosphate glucokinase
MKILAIDVGGTHVKVLMSGEREPRKFESGPTLTAKRMVDGVKKITAEWKFDAVSIGFPGPDQVYSVEGSRPRYPINLCSHSSRLANL